MPVVYIVSPRSGTGLDDDPHRAQVVDDYSLRDWTHITERRNPPRRGAWPIDSMVIEAKVSDAQASAISSDSRYTVLFDGEIVTATKANRLEANLRAKGMGREKAADLKQMVRGSARIGVQQIVTELRKSGGG